jgi:hypothetical protein
MRVIRKNPHISRLLGVVFFLYSAGFSKIYTTRFDGTENPLSEGGAWSHTGQDWQPVQKADGIAYGTQTGMGGYDDSYAHLSGFGPDQTAWGVIQRTPGGGGIHEVEIHLRWSDSVHSAKGYECLLSYDGSYAQIVRWNGPFGDFTYIGWAASAPVPRTGDTLKASIAGNLITVYYNHAEIMRATDSTYGAGDPGIGFYIQSGDANSDMGFTSFTASDESETSAESRPADAFPVRALLENYPNPFNACTTVRYTLRKRSRVVLTVLDLMGREVSSLDEGKMEAGTHEARFDADRLVSGVYFCRLEADDFVRIRKFTLLR